MTTKTLTHTLLCIAAAMVTIGCGEDTDSGTATARFALDREDAVVDGIAAGDDDEDITDGWAASFDRYVVSIGHIELAGVGSTEDADDERLFTVDLTQAQAGETLWEITGLAGGDYALSYEVGHAEEGEAVGDVGTVPDEASYVIEGSITQEGGRSCPPPSLATPSTREPSSMRGDTPCWPAETVRFEVMSDAETVFGPCEVDGQEGLSVPEGGETTAALTLHVDHIFFNGFPEGDEGGIQRLAQWLADCDLDLDGTVTMAELEQIAPSDLEELDSRFNLGGAPIAVTNMAEYVSAQLKTQGHFEGEGECAVDGVEHDHGHDDDDEDHDDHDDEDHDDE